MSFYTPSCPNVWICKYYCKLGGQAASGRQGLCKRSRTRPSGVVRGQVSSGNPTQLQGRSNQSEPHHHGCLFRPLLMAVPAGGSPCGDVLGGTLVLWHAKKWIVAEKCAQEERYVASPPPSPRNGQPCVLLKKYGHAYYFLLACLHAGCGPPMKLDQPEGIL